MIFATLALFLSIVAAPLPQQPQQQQATPAVRPDDLPRRGSIGLGLQPRPDQMAVVAVLRPGGPAERAGVLVSDRILSINGKTVGSQAELAELMRTLKGGAEVTIDLDRDGERLTLTFPLDPVPSESVPDSDVEYSSVLTPGGYRLRTIISTPRNSPLAQNAKAPAFMFVQGIYCASLDRPQAADAVDTRLVHALAKEGFVTLRVDKPGLGDSEGPPCSEINFDEELQGYKAALRQLASHPGVDASRIFIFGHSMGGVMAPYLSQEVPIRGTIVYGTLVRTWFEYQLENARRQLELSGASPAEVTQAVQGEARSSSMILVEKKTLGDVWDRYPELKNEGSMADATHLASRHMSFYHQLQDLNLAEAWQKSTGAVLALHGEYDWVTSKDDHDRIAAIVNAQRPGDGESVSMPKADHGFTLHDSLDASLRAMGQGRWDASLPKVVTEWIARVEGRTPAPEPESPTVSRASAPAAASLPEWTILNTERYPGKQDDIFFVSPTIGWYANGAGKIFKTTDGGSTWTQQVHMPGTFFRCLAFLDEKTGFAGNIGPGYFPNVSDTNPLYRTEDGGATWTPVTTIEGPPIVGLCALEVVREEFVNAGNLDTKTRIVGVGRVGGPAAMIVSDDLGKTWQQIPIAANTSMAFDVHFFDRNHGIIAGASSEDVTQSNARIITTSDAGKTWTTAYQSARPYELTWKISFPTRNVGYVTIQSYNPDPAASQRFVAKTADAGKTWTEVPLVDDHKVRQFGVAFIDENRGWIGAAPHGFQTADGGQTWSPTNFGNAVNKIRVLRDKDAVYAFAIGVQVSKVSIPASNANSAP